jgi:hypothetical protein
MMMTAGKCSQQVDLSGENINITYKPDGTHIAVGNRDDELTIIDVRKFKAIHKRKFTYEVNEIAWNTTGELFFLTTGNGLSAINPASPTNLFVLHHVQRYGSRGIACNLLSLYCVSNWTHSAG